MTISENTVQLLAILFTLSIFYFCCYKIIQKNWKKRYMIYVGLLLIGSVYAWTQAEGVVNINFAKVISLKNDAPINHSYPADYAKSYALGKIEQADGTTFVASPGETFFYNDTADTLYFCVENYYPTGGSRIITEHHGRSTTETLYHYYHHALGIDNCITPVAPGCYFPLPYNDQGGSIYPYSVFSAVPENAICSEQKGMKQVLVLHNRESLKLLNNPYPSDIENNFISIDGRTVK